jgi:cytochrome c oxidase subunit IV
MTHEHQIVPKSVYYIVWAWLAVLFVATVAAAQIDLGGWNVPLALAIAGAKASLIVLYFMHARYGSPLIRLFAASGFVWLAVLLLFLASDLLARNWPGEREWPVNTSNRLTTNL